MFKIRNSTAEDYIDLLPLLISYFKDLPNLSYTVEYLVNMFQRCWISPKSSMVRNWLIIKSERIVGFLIGNIIETLKNNVGILTFHILACKVEGGNDSPLLIRTIKEDLKKEGIGRITLSVEADRIENSARIRLFQGYGFKVKYVLMELE